MIRIIVFSLLVFLITPAFANTTATSPEVEMRVTKLMNQLTLDEKLKLLSGINGRFIPGIPRMGLPELKMSDGPVGAHNDGPDTAYPSAIALAASWDADLALRFGKSIGSDAHARGVNFLLGPAMNIYRVPVCGRNSEYLGEDPYLSGTMAAQIVRGVQSEGVCATLKHYAANNQEDHRGTVSVETDERTLREIYMRQFEIAVREAHPWAVMAAYNRINGVYCTANHWLLTDVLKNEWGFAGLVMSDWTATHDTLGPANAGLDLEMPGGVYFIPGKLLPLIKNGSIAQSTIDDKVRRILRVMVAMDYLHTRTTKPVTQDDPASAATALQIAREGTVLLKNDGHLLPLDRAKIKTIVVVGPNADPAITGCGGSSFVDPFHSVSVLAGLKKIGGSHVNIIFIPTDDHQELDNLSRHSIYQPLDNSSSGTLRAEFFNNRNLRGKARLIRSDSAIDCQWNAQNPPPVNLRLSNFSVRWTGKILAPADGEYTFSLCSLDGSRLFIGNKEIINLWSEHPVHQITTQLHLTAGKIYPIRVEFFSAWGKSSVQFGWGPTELLLNASEKRQIASADAAIICAGFNPRLESEGFDRTYALPGRQNELIQMVTRINPHSVLIINAGGNVDMKPWIDHVPALLQAWYPGQEGGTALAEILFGDVCPSGHLPATFEKQWKDTPAFGNYPGADDKVAYQEGIFVGYRYFDAKGVKPRFPFGFGLSYTSFKFSNLRIKPISPDGQQFAASVEITNTGLRDGSDVAQFYVGQDHPSLPRPPRWLAGFAKISLRPGESKTCSVILDPSSLCYWETTSHHWKVDPGKYHIWTGDSSRSLSLNAEFAYR